MFRLQTILFLLLVCCATPTANGPSRFNASSFKFQNTVDLGDVDQEGLLSSTIAFQKAVTSGKHEITVRIDSPGGSIVLGHRWLRLMEDLKKTHDLRVTCVVDGMAASMGAVILESPLCDERLATQRSILLFHNSSTTIRGNTGELQQANQFLEAFNEAMALTVSSRLGVPIGVYQAKIAAGDWVLSVTEALSVNAIDGIVSPNDIAPPMEG